MENKVFVGENLVVLPDVVQFGEQFFERLVLCKSFHNLWLSDPTTT
jgi:hypothetical protein